LAFVSRRKNAGRLLAVTAVANNEHNRGLTLALGNFPRPSKRRLLKFQQRYLPRGLLLALPHARHCTPSASASAFSRGRASERKAQALQPAQPQHTLLYRTIAEHFETWLELPSAGQFDGQGDHHTPKTYVRQAFRKYLECGIFAHGFARGPVRRLRARLLCGLFLQGTRCLPLVQHAANGGDGCTPSGPRLPRLPVCKWELSVPKPLRYFMQ
jgi:hypothetical protein